MRNNVILIGTLNTQVKDDQGGKKRRASFQLDTLTTFIDDDGEKTTMHLFHNIVAWGPMASMVLKYLSEGQQVIVEGQLITQQRGFKQVTEVHIDDVMITRPEGLTSRG